MTEIPIHQHFAYGCGSGMPIFYRLPNADVCEELDCGFLGVLQAQKLIPNFPRIIDRSEDPLHVLFNFRNQGPAPLLRFAQCPARRDLQKLYLYRDGNLCQLM